MIQSSLALLLKSQTGAVVESCLLVAITKSESQV